MINLKSFLIITLFLFFTQFTLHSQDVKLPEPQITEGMPLMEALSKRKSTRDFIDKKIPLQILSNLLWAANGFNRPKQELRTTPSAWNIQNVQIYLANSEGLYLYDALNNSLRLIQNEDLRAETGLQDFVRYAAVNLIYVADMSKVSNVQTKGELYSAIQTGCIAQNVYLFCASSNLGTVVRDMIDRDSLRKVMKLEKNQEIILSQSVGYTK